MLFIVVFTVFVIVASYAHVWKRGLNRSRMVDGLLGFREEIIGLQGTYPKSWVG